MKFFKELEEFVASMGTVSNLEPKPGDESAYALHFNNCVAAYRTKTGASAQEAVDAIANELVDFCATHDGDLDLVAEQGLGAIHASLQ